MPLASGTQIQNYRVKRLLGKGGMGEVYLAEDITLGREVAVKILPADLVGSAVRRKRFEVEARAASSLNHPNSAVVYTFGEWSGGAFIAVEYVPGETLHDLLKRGPLPVNELVRIGVQIADVLHAAHLKGITHRDVKPQNIMLTPQGQVKLLDFGLAKLVGTPYGQNESATQTMLTEAGAVVGTLGYLSPEHALGKPVDARSDVFALGIVFYEMATARRPFEGATAAEVLSKILTSAPEPIARWNYDIPPEIDRMVRKCLEKAPEKRYQTARDLLVDLQAWQRDSTATPAMAVPQQPRFTRRRIIMAAGGAGAAAACVAGYFTWAPPTLGSLAVLPFENQGSPEHEILSDGLTEALIDQVASAGALRVIARSAVFRLRNDDALAIGRKLKTEFLVVGRLRAEQSIVQVWAELIQVATAQHLWGDHFSLSIEGLQSLPGQLVDQLLRALKLKRRQGKPTTAPTVDPEAYQYYLKGRHALNRREPDAYTQATGMFRKAIEIAPLYAAAYAALSEAYALQSGALPPKDVCPPARAAAQKALDLDPASSEAYTSRAFVRMHFDFAWANAERDFRQAIELNASNPKAHSYLSHLLTATKRFPEAEAEQKKAIELDPLAATPATALARIYYFSRRYDDAEKQLRKVLADQPRFISAQAYLGLVHIAQKKYGVAINDLEQCLRMMADDDYGVLADLSLAYALSGNTGKARDALQRIEKIAEKDYVAPYFLAAPWLGLGDKDRALHALEQAVDPDRSWPVIYYAVEPKLDPVRREPRFAKLLGRLALPS